MVAPLIHIFVSVLVLTLVSHFCSLPGFYYVRVSSGNLGSRQRCTRGTPYSYTYGESVVLN